MSVMLLPTAAFLCTLNAVICQTSLAGLDHVENLANWPDSSSHWADVPGWPTATQSQQAWGGTSQDWNKQHKRQTEQYSSYSPNSGGHYSSQSERVSASSYNGGGGSSSATVGYSPSGGYPGYSNSGLSTSGYSPPGGYSPLGGYSPPGGFSPPGGYSSSGGYSQPGGYAPTNGYSANPPKSGGFEPPSSFPPFSTFAPAPNGYQAGYNAAKGQQEEISLPNYTSAAGFGSVNSHPSMTTENNNSPPHGFYAPKNGAYEVLNGFDTKPSPFGAPNSQPPPSYRPPSYPASSPPPSPTTSSLGQEQGQGPPLGFGQGPPPPRQPSLPPPFPRGPPQPNQLNKYSGGRFGGKFKRAHGSAPPPNSLINDNLPYKDNADKLEGAGVYQPTHSPNFPAKFAPGQSFQNINYPLKPGNGPHQQFTPILPQNIHQGRGPFPGPPLRPLGIPPRRPKPASPFGFRSGKPGPFGQGQRGSPNPHGPGRPVYPHPHLEASGSSQPLTGNHYDSGELFDKTGFSGPGNKKFNEDHADDFEPLFEMDHSSLNSDAFFEGDKAGKPFKKESDKPQLPPASSETPKDSGKERKNGGGYSHSGGYKDDFDFDPTMFGSEPQFSQPGAAFDSSSEFSGFSAPESIPPSGHGQGFEFNDKYPEYSRPERGHEYEEFDKFSDGSNEQSGAIDFDSEMKYPEKGSFGGPKFSESGSQEAFDYDFQGHRDKKWSGHTKASEKPDTGRKYYSDPGGFEAERFEPEDSYRPHQDGGWPVRGASDHENDGFQFEFSSEESFRKEESEPSRSRGNKKRKQMDKYSVKSTTPERYPEPENESAIDEDNIYNDSKYSSYQDSVKREPKSPQWSSRYSYKTTTFPDSSSDHKEHHSSVNDFLTADPLQDTEEVRLMKYLPKSRTGLPNYSDKDMEEEFNVIDTGDQGHEFSGQKSVHADSSRRPGFKYRRVENEGAEREDAGSLKSSSAEVAPFHKFEPFLRSQQVMQQSSQVASSLGEANTGSYEDFIEVTGENRNALKDYVGSYNEAKTSMQNADIESLGGQKADSEAETTDGKWIPIVQT